MLPSLVPTAGYARFARLRVVLKRDQPAFWHQMVRGAVVALFAMELAGCVVVPQNRRRYLADPTMLPDDPLEARARDKLHTSREGASGGNGQPAGGGCGCGN